MKKKSINLFQDNPKSLDQELVEKLISNDYFRMERIVSRGHASPSGFWYDQDEHEWEGVSCLWVCRTYHVIFCNFWA